MAGELEFSEELRVWKEDAGQEQGKKKQKGLGVWPYRVLLLILLWLELTATAGCFITLLKLSVQMRPLIYAGAACGLMWLFFFSIRGRWRYLLLFAYAAAVVFLFRRNLELVREGFFYAGNSFNRLFFNYYKASLFYFEVSEEEGLCCAAFFAFLMQPAAACYAQTLFRARGRLISMALLFMAALSGLALGLIPAPVFLIGAFFAALLQLAFTGSQSEYCVRGGKIRKEYGDGQKMRAKTALFLGVLFVLLGLVTSNLIDAQRYRDRMGMREKKQQLQEEINQFAALPVWKKIASAFSSSGSLPGVGKGGATARIGGLNSGRFSRAAQIGFDNVTALYVTLPELDRAVYLRGYTGAVYTKAGWEELGRDAEKEYEEIKERYEISSQEQGYRMMEALYRNSGPVLQDYYELGDEPKISKGEMRVEYASASKRYVYAPYYINPLERGDYNYEQDGYLTSQDREEVHDFTFLMPHPEFLYRFGELAERNQRRGQSYTIYEWQGGMENVLYRRFSEAYQEFVYEYYTEVPEGHEEIGELLPGAKNASINDKIGAVQQYLAKYEYTLSPGEMPPDADFVNYFLFENKKGYCVHFASSAVLMLRSLGVPARYAEGYLITQADINEAEAVGVQTINERLELRVSKWGYEAGLRPPATRVVLQKRVDVRDYAAHAWVEVYMKEIGWVPVEVTGGYMEDVTAGRRPEEILREVEGLPEPTAVPAKDATPTPLPTNTPTPVLTGAEEILPEDVVSPTSAPQGSATPTPPEKTSPAPGGGDGNGSGDEKTPPAPSLKERFAKLPAWARNLIKGCVLFLCAASILLLRYRIVWRIRTRRGQTGKTQVLQYYARMERILCRMGLAGAPQEGYEEFAARVAESGLFSAENFALCQRTALAAGFGGKRITMEEAKFVMENYGKMREELFAKCRALRKCYLKFIKLY